MYAVSVLFLLVLVISPAPCAPNTRASRDNSDNIIFIGDSREGAGSYVRSSLRVSTTNSPPMTFRGRAPFSTTVTTTTTTLPPTTTRVGILRKLANRVEEFFGGRKTTTLAPTTTTTTPVDAEPKEGESGADGELDTRIIIDAPAINGQCPSGTRMAGSRCRQRF